MSEARDTSCRDECAAHLGQRGPIKFSRAELNAPMIWNFAESVHDANPVYWDATYAKQTRFGRIIAPPHSIMTMSGGHWWAPDYIREREEQEIEAQGDDPTEAVRDIVARYGYTTATNVTREDEFLQPYGPGDGRIKQTSYVDDVSEEKQTAVGKGVFIITIIEYRRESDDEMIARARNVLLDVRLEPAARELEPGAKGATPWHSSKTATGTASPRAPRCRPSNSARSP